MSYPYYPSEPVFLRDELTGQVVRDAYGAPVVVGVRVHLPRILPNNH